MKRLLPALAILLLGLATGCGNTYKALTAPPPGMTASLDSGNNAIKVSKGVSIAFECTDSQGNPCGGDAASDDPGTALAFPASLDGVAEIGHQPRSAFVVVGIAAGLTNVQAGGDSLSVTVVP